MTLIENKEITAQHIYGKSVLSLNIIELSINH